MTRTLGKLVVLGLVLASVVPVARAQSEVQGTAGASAQRDPLFADDGHCSIPVDGDDLPGGAGTFAPLGAAGHDLEADLSLGTNGDLFGGTLRVAGIVHRFDRYWSLLLGVSSGLAYRHSVDTTLGSTPIVEAGIVARSECDLWHVTGTLLYAPALGTWGSPHDWQTTLEAIPSLGPWTGLWFLPRSDLGGLVASFDTRVRTNEGDVFGLFRFGFRIGAAQVGSQFGTLAGVTGAIALDGGIGVQRAWGVPLNLALSLRAEVDVSGFWPANAVAPFLFAVPLRWEPERWLAFEGWVGYAGFLVRTAADLPPNGVAGGVRASVDLDL